MHLLTWLSDSSPHWTKHPDISGKQMTKYNPQDETRIASNDSELHEGDDDFSLELSFGTDRPVLAGRYQIIRALGKGGFGAVYLANDNQLDRQVAVKVPHKRLPDKKVKSFLEEARVVASLDHEHIVPVFDVVTTDECPIFIVSKFIEGVTLRDKISGQRLAFDETAQLVATIADALHYAHKRELVHRDVKPGNILISPDNKPYLLDFGLAIRNSNFGDPLVLAGTPSYMSPEQIRGEGHRVDGRSDVFSLGVVLYLLLTGEKPFRGKNESEVLMRVSHHDPKPPRQIDDGVPRELERICFRALEKRASDRYLTAKDLAEDLRHFLDSLAERSPRISASPSPQNSGVSDPNETQTLTDTQRSDSSVSQLHIVPRGLRSFESTDADFFISLLPGPRDRDGLPDSLRFWRSRIEETATDETFPVGLIYGPSGCGKSSFVRAGLLPLLSDHVEAIYIESSREDTETKILKALRKRWPHLPQAGLKETIAALRQGDFLASGRKLLIVLDQFEQWLHVPKDLEASELVDGMRQCDGGRVQCVLMVRDDFWMSVTRFMRALEIRLVEGRNSATIDLFDTTHAKKVLHAFGAAFDRLPAGQKSLSSEQQQFLQMAVDSLSNEGRVICVHLTVFAEMIKSRPWTPATLRSVGGSQGLGVAFLEDAFHGNATPPERRLHQKAARTVLQCLLPQSGADLKGSMRSDVELMEACGYSNRREDFNDLIEILDSSLRLISPIDISDEESISRSDIAGSGSRFYQLAHDYLVRSIRDWLTQKQQETRRGRAELLLAQRADMWNAQQETRQLPSMLEWLRIATWTRRQDRTDNQQKMMKAATRRHGLNLAIVALVLVALFNLRAVYKQQQQLELARVRVGALMAADLEQAPDLIAEQQTSSTYSVPLLQSVLESESSPPRDKLYASLALLPHDPSQLSALTETSLSSTPNELDLIANILNSEDTSPADQLWKSVNDPSTSDNESFRALCLLAQCDHENDLWSEHAEQVSFQLTQNSSLSAALQWAKLLRPARDHLAPVLARVFRDSTEDSDRNIALNILSDYAIDKPDLLASVVTSTSPDLFPAILPALKQNQESLTKLLSDELEKPFMPNWPVRSQDLSSAPPENIVTAFRDSKGLVTKDFAICQIMPLDTFKDLANSLSSLGYRPSRFRPFEYDEDICVAATWERDGLKSHIQYGSSADEIRQINREQRKAGLLPVDVCHYQAKTPGGERQDFFCAVWSERWPGINDAGMYVGVTEEKHGQAYQPFVNNNYSVHSNVRVRSVDGVNLYSSVRWKMWHEPRVNDAWANHPDEYSRRQHAEWAQRDVQMTIESESPDSPRFSAAWWDGSRFETRRLHLLNSKDHLKECYNLEQQGFRPWSVSIRDFPDGLAACSIWARPFDETGRDLFSQTRARITIALAHLGQESELWAQLSRDDDPRFRSVLIDDIAAYKLPIEVLIRGLSAEDDSLVSSAILLAISEYDLSEMDQSTIGQLIELGEYLFRDSPNVSVHSSSELLLRTLQPEQSLPSLNDRSSIPTANDSRQWAHNSEGHTLAIIQGPVTFRMGSLPQTIGRDNYREIRHMKRINRTFAIGTKEVTVEQFLRYKKDFDFADSMSRSPNCPINSTTWYDAAKYCRWLSELEDLPPDQMCFPELDKIGPDMRLPDDYIDRTGYRLPTEAEWEYACRGGTQTERPFGQTEMLIDRYAWTARNSRVASENQLMPVGLLRPNNLGLFDVLGNVMEWCQDTDHDYPTVPPGTVVDDSPQTFYVSNEQYRPLRGGAFLYQPSDARAGHRNNSGPPRIGPSHPYVGFRIARTIKPE